MKKYRKSLEQRIFILFLIITFLMVMALIMIEWQLAKFGIKQYETRNISKVITAYRSSISQVSSDSMSKLKGISSAPEWQDLLKNRDKKTLENFMNSRIEQPLISNLAVYSSDLDLVYGSSWELVESYLNSIQTSAREFENGFFFSNFGNKIYQISYQTIREDQRDPVAGYIINVEGHNINSYSHEFLGYTFLLPYPLQQSMTELTGTLEGKEQKLENEILRSVKRQLESDIYWLGSDLAAGVVINYDLESNPVAVFLLSYPRDINMFAEQSVLIFFLILIAISIIMITILGTWFRIKILQPVKVVSNTMQQISRDPARMITVDFKYEGVLGEMVEIFKDMNESLHKFSHNLMEYKALTDNLESGIFWLDSDFRIILFNPGLMRILETDTEQELLNSNLNDYIKLDPYQKNKALAGSLTIPNLEIDIKGRKKFVLVNIRILKTPRNTKYHGNITDITQEIKEKQAREALELELIKSNRMAELGRRVEGIVHNINSPLNSLLGYAQLLKKTYRDNQDLDKILKAGKNITHMVKGLLSKVKSDSSSMIRPLDINDLINQEMGLLNHNLFFKHHVKIRIELAEGLPQVRAVYGDISLCLANIINNALEAMHESETKELSLKTNLEDNLVVIEISDTGEGILRENMEVIFEPYFTTKLSQNGSGFGLGLAISKNIALKYKGRIEVDSTRHKGSSFRIYLPGEKENG